MNVPDVVFLSFGSYNPPTPLHFRIFEIAKDHFEQTNKSNVSAGIVCPIYGDSFDERKHVSIQHRKAMISLALKSSNWINLSDREWNTQDLYVVRDLLQYHENTINNIASCEDVDSACQLRKCTKSQQKVKVKLLGGLDLFENYFKLKEKQSEEELEQILQDHGLVIVSKSNAACEKIIFDSDLLNKYRQNITLVANWSSSEIRSSLVRRLISRKQSVKYLLDDSVIGYIRDNNLYVNYFKNDLELKLPEPLHNGRNEQFKLNPPADDNSKEQQYPRKHPVEYNGDLSKFLKFAIETKRIKAVRKEQFFV